MESIQVVSYSNTKTPANAVGHNGIQTLSVTRKATRGRNRETS